MEKVKSFLNWFVGKRTYIVAGLMVLIGLIQALSGDLSWSDFWASPELQLILGGLGFAGLRAGVAGK